MDSSEGRVTLDGHKLKNLRKKMCLSQSLFVERCNSSGGLISVSTLKRAEAGKKVYFRTARDIAKVFSIEVCEITVLLSESDKTSEALNLNEYIIGRTHQLEQSKLILRNIKKTQNGHLYYIRGVAGIGKSHLIKAIEKISQAEGFEVIKLSVFEAASSRKNIFRKLILQVLYRLTHKNSLKVECLETLLTQISLSEEQEFCLYSILDFTIPPRLRLISTDYTSKTKAEISTLLLLFKMLQKPVSVILEDIHWADDSLLMTIKFIASEIRSMEVALILTSRLENDPLNKIWRSSVQNTPFTTLDLPPLSKEEVKKMVNGYPSISENYKNICLSMAQGNPLFLKLLLENYPNSLDDIPKSLSLLVEQKISMLSTQEKEFITIASALGHEFELETVNNLHGNAAFNIETLIECYLIHPVDNKKLQFSHDLVRQAIYQNISKKEKYKIHQRIADYYNGSNSSLHAFHLTQANNNKAIKALQKVAEKHYKKKDYSEALVQVDLALAISESFSLIALKGTLLKMLDLPAKSTQYFEKALKLAEKDQQKLEICLELIDVYAVNLRQERSLHYLEIAEKLNSKNPDLKIEARINKYKRHLHRRQNSLNSVNNQLQYSKPENLNGKISELNLESDFKLKQQFSGIEKVAILHSKTGILKDHELAVMKTCLMAIDEINENGGLLGKKIVYEIFDGESDEWVFKSQAEKILNDHKINTIFGCSISSTRKQVKEVIEQKKGLLVYPFHYEGLEESPNIAYIGPTPNLQAIPGIEWLYENDVNSFYLIGSDYIYPVVTNEIIKDSINNLGANVCGESYIPLGTTSFQSIIEDIAIKKPDCIVMTIAGLEGNKEFLKQLYNAKLKDKSTILSLVLSDNDICEIPAKYCSEVYSIFSYFQNHNDGINDHFLREFKARYGKEERVGGYMESGYVGVHLWAKAVQKSKSFNPQLVKEAMKGVSHYGPGGIAYLDEKNQHTWRYVRIAQVGQDGEYHVVWSSENPVAPEPFPSSRTKEEWETFLNDLKQNRWNGKWELQTDFSNLQLS